VRNISYIIRQDKKLTQSDAFAFIVNAKLQPQNKSHVYSNSGYILLTKIIENVSGMSYANFIQQRFFNKFGMKDAFVMSTIAKHKNYAEGYTSWPLYTPSNWMKAIVLSGDGGIFMSMNDFQKWIYAFENNKIFAKKETMKKFLSIGTYDDGKDVTMRGSDKYGFGLIHSEKNKNGKKYNIIFHSGGMAGSTALFSNIQSESESIWLVYLNNASSYPDSFAVLDQAKIKY